MTNEVKQDFMLRITQANASALVVILYDMFEEYCNELTAAEPGSAGFRNAMRGARGCLSELIQSLNRPSSAAFPADRRNIDPGDNAKALKELVENTYSLYRYVERQLIQADVKRDASKIPASMDIMKKLRDSYAASAKNDNSAPIMKNTDVIYAGMTYGSDDINTASAAAGTNRGYLV